MRNLKCGFELVRIRWTQARGGRVEIVGSLNWACPSDAKDQLPLEVVEVNFHTAEIRLAILKHVGVILVQPARR